MEFQVPATGSGPIRPKRQLARLVFWSCLWLATFYLLGRPVIWAAVDRLDLRLLPPAVKDAAAAPGSPPKKDDGFKFTIGGVLEKGAERLEEAVAVVDQSGGGALAAMSQSLGAWSTGDWSDGDEGVTELATSGGGGNHSHGSLGNRLVPDSTRAVAPNATAGAVGGGAVPSLSDRLMRALGVGGRPRGAKATPRGRKKKRSRKSGGAGAVVGPIGRCGRVALAAAWAALPPTLQHPWLVPGSPPPHVPLTAEAVEAAIAARGPTETSGWCAAAAGGWCRAFAAQAPLPPSSVGTPPPADKRCPGTAGVACTGHGVCDAELGTCACRAGWQGDACGVRHYRRCNWPYNLAVSSCAGDCDDTIGACHCAAGYPAGGLGGRPLGDDCKPNKYEYFVDTFNFTVVDREQWDAVLAGRDGTKPAGAHLGWGHTDPALLFGDPAKHAGIKQPGWCVALPSSAGGPPPARACGCMADGRDGHLCETVVKQTCPSDCSGRGECDKGFCWCSPGYFGADCSRPSADAPAPAPAPTPPMLLRPRIYVYDLPPRLNTHIFQYRMSAHNCRHRRFRADGKLDWSGGAGYMDSELHETLLTSPHRTMDPSSADFFYVPLFLNCLIWPVAGYASYPRHVAGVLAPNRQQIVIDFVLEARDYIASTWPHWNASRGRDHLWYFGHDEGACFAPHEIRQSVLLTHWGRMDDLPTPVSSSAFEGDNYDNSNYTLAFLGRAPCFDPAKDILLPPFTFHGDALSRAAAGTARDIFFSFAGNTGETRNCVNKARCYARGLRQKVHKLFKGRDGFVFGGLMYADMLSRSTFCLVAPGDGFSTRMEDAVLHGCIPVIVMDNTLTSLCTLLDCAAFTVRIAEADLASMADTLRAIPKARDISAVLMTHAAAPTPPPTQADVAAKLALVKAVGSRFAWAGVYGNPPFAGASGRPDALATLMGALYWRALQHDQIGLKAWPPPPLPALDAPTAVSNSQATATQPSV